MKEFYAHTSRDWDLPVAKSPPDTSKWQPLKEHLVGVAIGASERAGEAIKAGARLSGLESAAYAAALLHDLGKYRQGFQRKLLGEDVGRRAFHKEAGAAKAFEEKKNTSVAFAIAGHHGGLPNRQDLIDAIEEDDAEAGLAVALAIWPIATVDCLELKDLVFSTPLRREPRQFDLFTRVLFSILVDADWSDTAEYERVMRGWPEERKPDALAAAGLLRKVMAFIDKKAKKCVEESVRLARAEVLNACLASAEESPGIFSLTVPTGGGKTLAVLAFALRHAAVHGKRRIIYVAPYLSILDQNARELRKALGFGPNDPAVFEHHSLSEPWVADKQGVDDKEETRLASARRRAENWDAPIIITTNVQFFESLFSNQPGRCRKLHNIAGSVVVLDECQTIPPELLAPTCAMLEQLSKELGCTIVLCTATRPAFSHEELLKLDSSLHDVREIVPDDAKLFERLDRVRVTWPKKGESLEWKEVTRIMASEDAALCVVNSKLAAAEVFKALKELKQEKPVFHLSTNMCPAHRMSVIKHVKSLLIAKKTCLLVSTQLIEAGVDLDFPLVMRELAPLESIIQAAGRCNREGKLKDKGRVVVFRSRAAEKEPGRYYPPDLWYKAGREIVQQNFLNLGREPRIDDPKDIAEYYERLFHVGEIDKKKINSLRESWNFHVVAQHYRLIKDDTVAVVSIWNKRERTINRLLDELRVRPRRALFRKLARYQVNVRSPRNVSTAPPEILVWSGNYDDETGIGDLEECIY